MHTYKFFTYKDYFMNIQKIMTSEIVTFLRRLDSNFYLHKKNGEKLIYQMYMVLPYLYKVLYKFKSSKKFFFQ